MAAFNPVLNDAIRCYGKHLIECYEAENGHHINSYSDTSLSIIASFDGNWKLLEEYQVEVAGF